MNKLCFHGLFLVALGLIILFCKNQDVVRGVGLGAMIASAKELLIHLFSK